MQTAPVTRDCPACGARCPGTAQICYSCKKPLPEVAEFVFDDAEVDAVRAAVSSGQMPHGPAILEQPRKIRPATGVWFALTCLGFATPGLTHGRVESVSTVGVVFAMFAIWIFLILLIIDLATPAPRGRRTADQAVRCFFKNLRRGRFASAHACLSPLVYERRVRVPAIAKLRSKPEELSLSDAAHLKQYWSSLARPGGGMARRISALRVTRVSGDDLVARYAVRLRISAYPRWYLVFVLLGLLPGALLIALLEDHVESTFEVLVHPKHGQYWVYGGELGHRPA